MLGFGDGGTATPDLLTPNNNGDIADSAIPQTPSDIVADATHLAPVPLK